MNKSPFDEIYEATPDAVVVIDRSGHILFANKRVEALLGYAPRDLVGKPHGVLMPARYHDTHTAHVQRFMIEPKPRIMGPGLDLYALRKDGSEFKTEISLSPYQAPDGLVVIAAMRDREALVPSKSALEFENAALRDTLSRTRLDSSRLLEQAGIEAAEHEASQRLQRLLLEELHHRMKNMLATVVGIASQTLRASETLEEGRQAVSSRLVAMGRAQDLLLRANEISIELADLISAAIEPFDIHEVRRFVVQNTLIVIGPGAILPLTMSLNELCTNAVKYGALSNETGRVNITSTVDEETQLFSLTWTETGGPVVQEPVRRSFGTRLLGALATQLHGDVRLRYEPQGVVYQIDIPLALLRTLRAS
ncbi:PAS domain S-box protein [Phreatobacter aquaticus]|uniref:Blue-light-activated histidine kinase n=1 Tax=Phreatobacter aquaticus TaxID=2570229 RepID=A0A4D7QLI3_9HYPH|nr:HWE histidine kinase domain-containing protein [Phreatobacter aquaticus]QCK88025.1 PAS domain S-box protein [Phreatobacter aquaticus]